MLPVSIFLWESVFRILNSELARTTSGQKFRCQNVAVCNEAGCRAVTRVRLALYWILQISWVRSQSVDGNWIGLGAAEDFKLEQLTPSPGPSKWRSLCFQGFLTFDTRFIKLEFDSELICRLGFLIASKIVLISRYLLNLGDFQWEGVTAKTGQELEANCFTSIHGPCNGLQTTQF
jgi:hypothetical protein